LSAKIIINMKINSYKGIAYKILQESKKPLHCKEIAKIALKKKLLSTIGTTPEQTMCAILYVDGNSQDKKSRLFDKIGPATFRINPLLKKIPPELIKDKVFKISKCSPKQKGDIAEARIAELITLYGNKKLACYKPLSDDEGIDIIVKQKNSPKTLFIQVKSRFGDNPRKGVFVSTVKTSSVQKDNFAIIFCFFDTKKGDVWDYLWIVPGKEFSKHARSLKKSERLLFVSGTDPKKISNKWSKYLIDKRDLANTIISQMH